MWATYQLIENHDDQAKVFVEDCLDSEDEEICEAGIFLIGKHKLRDHEFRLLGIFQHSKGRMKRASAIALCALDSESSRSLLWALVENADGTGGTQHPRPKLCGGMLGSVLK